jgi:hypothetical protein
MAQDYLAILDRAQAILDGSVSKVLSPPPPKSSMQLLAEAEAILDAQSPAISITPKSNTDNRSFRVSRVIDGDTIILDGIGRVRLTNLDTPETVHPNKPAERGGREASAMARLMMEGRNVQFKPSPEGRDVYDRSLGTIILPGGREANATMAEHVDRYQHLLERDDASMPTHGQKQAAVSTMVRKGLLQGLIYPISAFMPDVYDNLKKEVEEAKGTFRNYLDRSTTHELMGNPGDNVKDLIAGVPGMGGFIVGTMGPGAGLFSATRAAFGGSAVLAKHLSLRIASGASAGAMFPVAAKLEEGQSRFSMMAIDAVLGSLGEAVMIPFMLGAMKKESGAAAVKAAVRNYAHKNGVNFATAERAIAQASSGGATRDPELVARVREAVQGVSGFKDSPTLQQLDMAAEMVDAYGFTGPNGPTIDTTMAERGLVAEFTIDIKGTRQRVEIARRNREGPNTELDEKISDITSIINTNRAVDPYSVKLRDGTFASLQALQMFERRIHGWGPTKPATKPASAAPHNSVGETGQEVNGGDGGTTRTESGERVPVTVIASNMAGDKDRVILQLDTPEDYVAGTGRFERNIGDLVPGPEDITAPEDFVLASRTALRRFGLSETEIKALSDEEQHLVAALARGKRNSTYLANVKDKIAKQESLIHELPAGRGRKARAQKQALANMTAAEARRQNIPQEVHVLALVRKIQRGDGSVMDGIDYPHLARWQRFLTDLDPAKTTKEEFQVLARETEFSTQRSGPESAPLTLVQKRRTVVVNEIERLEAAGQGGRVTDSAARHNLEAELESLLSDATEAGAVKRNAIIDQLYPDVRRSAPKQDVSGPLAAARQELTDIDAGLAKQKEEIDVIRDAKKTPRGHVVPKGMILVENNRTGAREVITPGSLIIESPVGENVLPQLKTLNPHPDGGTERRGIVFIRDQRVYVANYGTQDPDFFNGSFWETSDASGEFEQGVRIIGRVDDAGNGIMDMSVTPTYNYVTEKIAAGGDFEHGVLDQVEGSFRRTRRVASGGGDEGSIQGIQDLDANKPGFDDRRLPSTVVPKAVRGPIKVTQREQPRIRADRGVDPEDALAGGPREGIGPTHFDENLAGATSEELFEPEFHFGERPGTSGLRKPMAGPGDEFTGEGFRVIDPIRGDRAPELEMPAYMLDKDSLLGAVQHAEWATFRQAARVMIKEGYDPSIPVTMRIATDMHRAVPTEKAAMTLRELAEVEFSGISGKDRLQMEAGLRGIRIRPEREGYSLTSDTGTQWFADDLEALNAIVQVPLPQTSFDIDAMLASEWNAGVLNGIDPAVNAAKYMPLRMQEVVLERVLNGGIPLVELRTANTGNFLSAFSALTEKAPNRIQAVMLDEFVDTAGTPGMNVAVYDADAVTAVITKYEKALTNLGIDVTSGHQNVVRQMNQFEGGLRAFKNGDPESGIMHTFYLSKSMKGDVLKGKLVLDETGPHRVYTQTSKDGFNMRLC